MIDLHCHILPFIDDGPSDWDGSLALANKLVEEGVTTVAATPHSYSFSREFPYKPSIVKDLVYEAQIRVHDSGINLRIVSGTEIRLNEYTLQMLGAKRLLPFGDTRTLLIESSSYGKTDTLASLITPLINSDYQLILAHPEKMIEVQDDPNVLIPIVEAGVAMQLTAANVAGINGLRLEELCKKLIFTGMGHIVASDAHSNDGSRAPYMRSAYERMSGILGRKARIIFETFPNQILRGTKFPKFSPERKQTNFE